MKKFLQRFFGIAVSAALVVSSGMTTVFAADGHDHHSDDTPITFDPDTDKYTITLTFPEGYKVNEENTDNSYDPKFGAYQIFTGTVKEKAENTNYVNPGNEVGTDKSMIPLTDIKWGNAFGTVGDTEWQKKL